MIGATVQSMGRSKKAKAAGKATVRARESSKLTVNADPLNDPVIQCCSWHPDNP